jgi:hypothetical protein
VLRKKEYQDKIAGLILLRCGYAEDEMYTMPRMREEDERLVMRPIHTE